MFLDTQSYSQSSKEAIEWFRGDCIGFRTVCEYAGFNPEYVRKKLDKHIAVFEGAADSRDKRKRAYIADRKVKKAAALFRKQEKLKQLMRLKRMGAKNTVE